MVSLLEAKGYIVHVGTTTSKTSKKRIVRDIKKHNYDAIICLLTDTIDREVMSACPTLKVIATYSVGFNAIDIEFAKQKGIFVTNTPGTSSVAVAEHTLSLMLALTTRLVEGDRFVRKGKFKGWQPNLLIGDDLHGKTIGLVGVGAIGSQVAKMVHDGFGCSILYTDIAPNQELELSTGAHFSTIDTVFKESDIISLHVPLLPTTEHLVNEKMLALMKPTAFLVNTARGKVVDEKALTSALKSRRIAGAALDVFEYEPKVTASLRLLDNVVLTPHIASSRKSVRQKMTEVVVSNIISVLETGKPINPVF